MMQLQKIVIHTQSIKKVKEFYYDILEFPIHQEKQGLISFIIGSSILEFLETKNTIFPYHFAFNIPSFSILECYEYYHKKISFLKPIINRFSTIFDFADWNAKSLYFLDHENNILEFIAREDIHYPLKEKFSSKDILSISEMGIVVDNAIEAGKYFLENYNIPPFIRSEGHEKFKPIGDDFGLLILCKENRNWFPTNIKAKKQFTQITLEIDGNIFEIENPL